MGKFSIKELYKNEIDEIWHKSFSDIDYFDRGYAIQNEIIENSILFVGMNPSFTGNELSEEEHFYDNPQQGKVYKYFSRFQEIAKEIQCSWAHIDLLFLRETNQQNVKKLCTSKNDKTKLFIDKQLQFSRKIIERSKPKIIVVSNAYAKAHLGFKTIFDPNLGTHKIIDNVDLENVPVFYTSMLTGQRALDNGSYDRLIWHLNYVKEKKNNDSALLWNDFKNSLSQVIKETPIDLLENAWESIGNRTEFYLGFLLPKVADKLKLGYEREKTFRVDGVFFKKAENDYPVPTVFVESENNSGDTETEIYKLCCLNAPLKVIFICCEWNENSRREITENYWQYIIDAFIAENRLIGHLGVIVAEWMDTLKFHSFVFNEQGKIIDGEKMICEIVD